VVFWVCWVDVWWWVRWIWVGYFWVLYLGFNWATYVYSLVYLEALGAFFDIYITYQKKKKN
jgi:hypothetical protein